MIAIGKGKLGNGELLVLDRDNYPWFFNPRHCGRTTTSNTTQLPTSDPYTIIRSTVDKLDVLFTIVEVTDSSNVESKMRAKVDYLEYKKGYIKIAGLEGKITILVVNDALIWEAE